jgi:hypothetical protein
LKLEAAGRRMQRERRCRVQKRPARHGMLTSP